jgi:hypothetical protein
MLPLRMTSWGSFGPCRCVFSHYHNATLIAPAVDKALRKISGRSKFKGPIVCAVRWYLRFSLSYRDVEELLMERALPADHTTIWRWVQRYAPELNRRCRRELKPTNGSWRVGWLWCKLKPTARAVKLRLVDRCELGSRYECRVPQFRHRRIAPAELARLELPLLDLLC